MLEFSKKREIGIEKVVEKMCHNPAICFKIKKRGFIREGYFADLVLVNLNSPWEVKKRISCINVDGPHLKEKSLILKLHTL